MTAARAANGKKASGMKAARFTNGGKAFGKSERMRKHRTLSLACRRLSRRNGVEAFLPQAFPPQLG